MKDRPPPSSAVFRCFPLFSAVLHPPRPSSTVPYQNMSQIVGFAVLPNDGRPGNSRTRTDGILSSRPVPGSGQSPAGPYGGPGRLRTLLLHIRSRRPTRVVFGVGYVRINVSLLKLPLLAAEGDCCVTIEISCLHIRFFIHLQ